MKKLRIITRISLVVAALVATLTFIGAHNVARAGPGYVAPHIVQYATASNMDNTTGTMSVTFPNSVTSGNTLIVLAGWGGGNSWSVSSGSSSQTLWNDLLAAGEASSDGLNDTTYLTEDTFTTGGSETVSLSLTENGCPCGSSWLQTVIAVFEINYAITSGYDASGHGGAYFNDENGTGGTVHTDNGQAFSCDPNLVCGEVTVGLYVDGGSNTTLSAPSPETLLDTNSPTYNIGYGVVAVTDTEQVEFDTSSSAGYSAMEIVPIEAQECANTPVCS